MWRQKDQHMQRDRGVMLSAEFWKLQVPVFLDLSFCDEGLRNKAGD